MATLARRGSGTPATTGTTWASVTNAVDGTAGTNPATYSTMTNATASAVATIEISGYSFDDTIVSGDTLNTVTVALRHFENNTGRFASVRFQPYDGATAIGSIFTATLATGARTDSTTFPVTLAQLRSSTFKIRVTITGAASTQSRVFSIDQVDVTADYTPLPPTITQAAYRFYDDDGTESTSTALAAQNTSVVGNLLNGDGFGQIRVMLQSTNAGAIAATDDWQLQYQRNSGTWTALQDILTNLVPNPSIEVNATGWAASLNGTIARDSTKGGAIAASGSWAVAATSTAAGFYYLDSASPYVPVLPSTAYRASAYVWVPTGKLVTVTVGYYTSALGFISESADTLSNGLNTWTRLSFTLTTPSNAEAVRFRFRSSAAAGGEQFWVDAVMLTAGSTLYSYFDGSTAGASWSGTAHNSASTMVVASTSTVVGYNSANLTDAAATTNRLTGGSGSFVAGKVSEDGLIDNLGWTANNYTELLYSVTLKAADLANGDVLNFRVLRNGATTGLTYTQTPTITIVAAVSGVGAGDWGGWTGTASATVEAGAAEVLATADGAWGAATNTALATVEQSATVLGAWGALTGTAEAAVDHAATAAGNWGALTGTAAGGVAGVIVTGSALGAWGALTATGLSTTSRTASGVGAWGSLTGTALGQTSRTATGLGTWGSLTGTGVAAVTSPGTAVGFGHWGGWTATATGNVSKTGTGEGTWGTLTGTAAGATTRTGTATGTWGAWTGTASATVRPVVPGAGTGQWGALTATAVTATSYPVLAVGAWGGWTATASSQGVVGAVAVGEWGAWTATAVATVAGVKGTVGGATYLVGVLGGALELVGSLGAGTALVGVMGGTLERVGGAGGTASPVGTVGGTAT